MKSGTKDGTIGSSDLNILLPRLVGRLFKVAKSCQLLSSTSFFLNLILRLGTLCTASNVFRWTVLISFFPQKYNWLEETYFQNFVRS